VVTEMIPEVHRPDIAQMIATRAERGHDLYIRKRQLIVRTGEDTYLVPGSGKRSYRVHYGDGREGCECADWQVNRGALACKHVVSVALMFAVRRRRVRRCEACGAPATEKTLVGLEGDRRREGPRWCLPHHPASRQETDVG
jgi:hypothetical protein